MKTTRRILALVQAVLLLAGLAIPALAAGEITPYYNNTSYARTVASISDSGVLNVTNYCNGLPGVTSKVVITTYVEKKILGLFWSKPIPISSPPPAHTGSPPPLWFQVMVVRQMRLLTQKKSATKKRLI